jgi:hypothetical protein
LFYFLFFIPPIFLFVCVVVVVCSVVGIDWLWW